MNAPGTLELLGQELGLMFRPLEARFGADSAEALLAELGLRAPVDLLAAVAFTEALGKVVTSVARLPGLIAQLVEAIETGNPDVAKPGIALITSIKDIVEGIAGVAAALDALSTSLASVSPAQREELHGFAGAFAERLLARLFVEFIEHRYGQLFVVFLAAGAIEIIDVGAGPAGSLQVAHQRKLIHFDRILRLLTDPVGLLRDVYKWGATAFDGLALFQMMKLLLEKTAGISAELLRPAGMPATLEAIMFSATVDPGAAGAPPGLAVSLRPAIDASVTDTLTQEDWAIDLSVSAKVAADVEFTLRPPFMVHFELPTGSADAALGVAVHRAATAAPIIIFGQAASSRLEVQDVRVGVKLIGHWDTSGVPVSVEPAVEIGFTGGKLFIDTSNSDGFIAKLLSGTRIEASFDLDGSWQPSTGLVLHGSAGIEIDFPLHLGLGPIALTRGHVGLGIDAAAALSLELSVGIDAALGPVATSIERMGVTARMSFPPGGGNVGPAQLDVGFKPPTGLGIVIEAGPVTGGGFISFDPDNGRYAGVLQLKLYEIGITAIGLLDTRLPGGKPGFSFLIIIAVEFTPIQLGFGFTLNGVGGLAGINRTLITEELRQGVREHSLENILFPQNPIARATQLISDLGRIFPPAEGRYVFGPMVKLGWASFVEAELGILIELPSPVRIVILGEVDAYFPLKTEAIIEIHLDVLGIVDFGAKLFSLDASLHDSRVLLFGLSGDMAMRLSWGDDPSFAFSLGGLNPHFQPPPAFPTLRRLTLTLGYGDNPRLSLEGYFALTSNSFQFGAALSLYASLGALEVKGFLGFDALFIFSPFSFIIDFDAGLDVTLGAWHLVGIHLHASLSGPTPWHISGELSVSLLFFDITAHIDFTLGDERHDTLPEVDTWAPLRQSIMAQASWEGERPPLALQAVRLSAPEGSGAPVLVDPVGGATLRERVLPLGQTITRFADVDIAPVRYAPDPIVLGRTTIAAPSVQDHFAPGAFRRMSDAEKISSPSFVWMQAGFTIASDAVAIGGALTLGVQYTTRIIDAPDQRREGPRYTVPPDALLAAARVAAAGTGLRVAGAARFAPDPRTDPRAAMNDEEFVVASKDDLAPQLAVTPPTSKGLAQSALAQHLLTNPADRDRLQVIPAADAAA